MLAPNLQKQAPHATTSSLSYPKGSENLLKARILEAESAETGVS